MDTINEENKKRLSDIQVETRRLTNAVGGIIFDNTQLACLYVRVVVGKTSKTLHWPKKGCVLEHFVDDIYRIFNDPMITAKIMLNDRMADLITSVLSFEDATGIVLPPDQFIDMVEWMGETAKTFNGKPILLTEYRNAKEIIFSYPNRQTRWWFPINEDWQDALTKISNGIQLKNGKKHDVFLVKDRRNKVRKSTQNVVQQKKAP